MANYITNNNIISVEQVFEVLHHVDIKHHAASCSGNVWQSILGLTAPGFHTKLVVELGVVFVQVAMDQYE
jgi:hypothetical protein